MAKKKGNKPRVTLITHSKEVVRSLDNMAVKKMYTATQIVRNKVLETLSGDRTGKRYKIPGTNKYYTASAPGEAPASRTGHLRQNIKTEVTAEGKVVTGRVGTDVKYGPDLEFGTRKMAPRPWLEKSFKEVEAEVRAVLGGRW